MKQSTITLFAVSVAAMIAFEWARKNTPLKDLI